MIDVFISYKREQRTSANAIATALEVSNLKIWWDIELLPGDEFSKEIAAIIEQARAVVVLWSESSVKSDFVRGEAELGRQRKVLVPVRLDDCKIPLPFTNYHTLDLRNWTGEASDLVLQPLIRSVQQKALTLKVADSNFPQTKPNGPGPETEAWYWREITSPQSASISEYRLYLERFGDRATFAELARVRIADLLKAKKARKRASYGKVAGGIACIALLAGLVGKTEGGAALLQSVGRLPEMIMDSGRISSDLTAEGSHRLTATGAKELVEGAMLMMLSSPHARSWGESRPRLIIGSTINNTDDESLRVSMIVDQVTEILIGARLFDILASGSADFDYVLETEITSRSQRTQNQLATNFFLKVTLFKEDGAIVDQWIAEFLENI